MPDHGSVGERKGRSDLRVLVVDDTLLFRHVVAEVLGEMPGIEVIGTAASGRTALSRIESLRPDLVTLDIEMPDMDGLAVLQEMKSRGLQAGVVILSALSSHGGKMTMRALELGAFDFVTKPSADSPAEGRAALRARLEPALRAFALRRRPAGAAAAALPLPRVAAQSTTEINRPAMALIGVSTGGPRSLSRVLPDLPADLGVPVLVVQHMPPLFTRSLAESLRPRCALHVKEAEHNERALPDCIYIAPGGRHMKVVPRAGEPCIVIDDEPPENSCRPSVDHLFRSAVEGFGGRAVAVIMTGMGNDGTAGMKLLRQAGARTVAQNEATCVVFGMPREAILAGVVDHILPLDEIAGKIVDLVRAPVEAD